MCQEGKVEENDARSRNDCLFSIVLRPLYLSSSKTSDIPRVESMSDPIRDLPSFPSEESNRYERTLGPRVEAPDGFLDRFRHAWHVYTILGALIGAWLTTLAVVGYYDPGWSSFVTVLLVPLGGVLLAVRFLRWSALFSSRREKD